MQADNLLGIGRNQWIRYDFGGHNKRVDLKSNLRLHFTEKIKAPISFTESRLAVAQDIYNCATGRDIYVAMSGGVDSEIIAQSFYEQKIPFKPLIVDLHYYSLHANYADTWWAKLWCKENSIQPVILNYSATDLLFKILPYVEILNARHLFPLLYVYLADYVKSINGILVTGQGLPEYMPDPNLDYLKNLNDQQSNLTGWIFHECDSYININDPGYHPYNFLSWTPEIVNAIINFRNTELDSELSKHNLYGCRIRPKMQGPDLLVNLIGEQQKKMRLKFGTSEIAFLGTTEELLSVLT